MEMQFLVMQQEELQEQELAWPCTPPLSSVSACFWVLHEKKLGAELQSVFKNKQIANVKASAILQAQGNVFYKEENNIQI